MASHHSWLGMSDHQVLLEITSQNPNIPSFSKFELIMALLSPNSLGARCWRALLLAELCLRNRRLCSHLLLRTMTQ